jgi:Flp pilus assembly pilin Flp
VRMKGEGMGEERCGVRRRAVALLRDCSGQGTTEYAILVGVLVVIAIVAIIAFKGKVQELWTAIADGMNSL